MATQKLMRIGVVSFSLMYGAICAVFGFFMGLLITLFSAVLFSALPQGALATGAIGLIAIIIYPIFGFIAGFIMGFILSVVYNFLAKHIGGIELELK